jgi:hypothetical protein
METLLRCSTCHELKLPIGFNLDASRATGRQARCKICQRAAALRYKLSDKGKASGRKYANSERGRLMEKLRRARLKQNKNNEQ